MPLDALEMDAGQNIKTNKNKKYKRIERPLSSVDVVASRSSAIFFFRVHAALRKTKQIQ